MSHKHYHIWPDENSTAIIAVVLCCLAFGGEPDLIDALIAWLKK